MRPLFCAGWTDVGLLNVANISFLKGREASAQRPAENAGVFIIRSSSNLYFNILLSLIGSEDGIYREPLGFHTIYFLPVPQDGFRNGNPPPLLLLSEIMTIERRILKYRLEDGRIMKTPAFSVEG